METTINSSNPTLKDSWIRWLVLALMSSTMFAAYMFVDVLSPLKTMLEETVHWDSNIFGTYAGSEYILNVFALFLIFAGVILDKMGIRFTAILTGILMVFGAAIKVYALSNVFNNGGPGFELLNSFLPSLPPSAKLACIGFAIFGCGAEMGGVMVSKVLVKWFSGKQLALAMGIEMSVARLGVFAVFRLSPVLASDGGVIKPVIIVGLLLCIALLIYILYTFFDSKLDKQQGGDLSETEEPFKFSDLKLIFGNGIFWIVALLCVLFYSGIFPFQKFATELIQSHLNLPTEEAAAIFSYFPIGAMILTPIIGVCLDYFGKGASLLAVGAILLASSHLMFAFYPFEAGDQISQIVMYTTITILGISFSLVPASLWPSVPKLIDGKVLGSAYSAIFWIQNVGLMLVPMLIGTVLTATNVGKETGSPVDYTYASIVFASFGVLAFILALILKSLDKKNGYGLEKPNATK